MKILIGLFVLLFSFSIANAEIDTAKLTLKDGDVIYGLVIDATGYTNGIEMDTAGIAYIIDSEVINAGSINSEGGTRSDGRGIVASGPGATIIVSSTEVHDNSEDGFRAWKGGTLTISDSVARNNGKLGYYVGSGGTMNLAKSEGWGNQYGFMAAYDYINIKITNSDFYGNLHQGVQIHEGGTFEIIDSKIYSNTTGDGHTDDDGGLGFFAVNDATVTDTKIYNNLRAGVFVDSTSHPDEGPSKVYMDGVDIHGNGTASIISKGDSVVTVINSSISDGNCVEKPDDVTGKLGIITVDGVEVVSGHKCPN